VPEHGPVARRLLSGADTDINNLLDMHPSPDGRFVAYTRIAVDGAVFTRDLKSGAVQQIVPGLPAGWNQAPIWSPDGRRLAFGVLPSRDAPPALKTVELTTREATTVPGTEGKALTPMDWSRDGKYLACRQRQPDRSFTLAIVTVGSGAISPVTDAAVRDEASVSGSFSPDSRFIAFARGPVGSEDIYVQPVTGGAARQITTAPGDDHFPLWSPDGRMLSYEREDGVWAIPVTNGEASGTPRVVQQKRFDLPFAWVPSGGLYYTDLNTTAVPYRIAADSGTDQPTAVVEEVPGYPRGVSRLAWSPDMRQVAFAGFSQEITVYSLDRKARMTYNVGPEGSASHLWWSEDGREVLFTSWERARFGKGSTVLALNPATGKVRELFPRMDSIRNLSLSGDGGRMLFTRSLGEGVPNGRSELVVAETGKAGGVAVAPGSSPEGGLSGMLRSQFSPSGDRVLFGRQAAPAPAGSGGSLWVVNSDGSQLRKIASAAVINTAVWDPRGERVAYVATGGARKYVLRVVELATGAQHDLPLPDGFDDVVVRDWSRDGKFIGVIGNRARWEYWVVERLLDGAR